MSSCIASHPAADAISEGETGTQVPHSGAGKRCHGIIAYTQLRFMHVQKATKRGIIRAEADHAWFVASAADDTSLIEHLAERRRASK